MTVFSATHPKDKLITRKEALLKMTKINVILALLKGSFGESILHLNPGTRPKWLLGN